MEKNGSLVKKVDILLVARKVRFLGIAIMVGVALVFILGLFVSANYINKDLDQLNLLSLIICCAFCFPSFYVKQFLFRKINSKNFMTAYFQAHLVPFALCDMGGLFCITTNLFVNQNIIFASAGFIVALMFLLINFPRSEDHDNLNLER